jgi:hypothetical protein
MSGLRKTNTKMKNIFVFVLISLSSIAIVYGIKGNRCYLITGYVYDMNYPFAYVLANERIIINEDTIFTDSSGRYQYLVFYNHLRDAKISLRWTSFNPNDVPIVISVRKQRIVLKSEWQKMEKYRRKDKLPEIK